MIRRRNREAEVQQAAIKVFGLKGYAATSVKDVAEEAGVLKGSLYHYIETKEDLLESIFDSAHEQAAALIESIQALDAPPLVKLRTYFERHVTWSLENVGQVTVFFREWQSLTGERLVVVKRRRRTYEEFILGLIEEAVASGDLDPALNSKLALYFILGAAKAVPDWYRPDGPETVAEIATVYADLTVSTLVGAFAGGAGDRATAKKETVRAIQVDAGSTDRESSDS